MASVIFLDGESKSGKTAVGRTIVERLNAAGLTTQSVTAGHFFRRLALLALARRPDDADENNDWLKPAVTETLKSAELYDLNYDAAELESPAVEAIVSSVGKLDVAQHAASHWRVASAEKALASGAQIILFDGRNLRAKLAEWQTGANLPVALELVIFCRADEAARRYLGDEGNDSPTEAELAAATEIIEQRRQADRSRHEAPYVDPIDPVELAVDKGGANQALELAYDASSTNPPRPIRFDNSDIPRRDGLASASELALLAIKRINN